MKAVVKFAETGDDIEVRDVPVPDINDNQVLLAVEAVGVCGSDVHMWRNHHSWAIKTPVIMGHEFSGVVERVGKNVTNVKPGERVACETASSVCGHCLYCRTGNYNMCPERLGFGNLIDGAMAEYVAVRPDILHRIPDNVSMEYAALAEPVCVGVNALVEKSTIKPGDLVVIQGVGAIGVFSMLVAKLCGAGAVIVLGTDADENRLRIAAEMGAARAVNLMQEDPLPIVASYGDGNGADVVVDCTGVSGALIQSMAMVRPLGQITKIGWGPQPLNASLDMLVQKAARLQASFSHTFATWERVLGLMGTEQLALGPALGGVYQLEDWEQAFGDMESGKNIKSVLRPS